MALQTAPAAAAPSNQTTEPDPFHEELKRLLPRLRVYALSLTRDQIAADDLVHDTVVKALAGRHSFQPGTNLSAWLFRIERNEFISNMRRVRPSVPVDSAIDLGGAVERDLSARDERHAALGAHVVVEAGAVAQDDVLAGVHHDVATLGRDGLMVDRAGERGVGPEHIEDDVARRDAARDPSPYRR